MEILKANYASTSTGIVINSNTDSAYFILGHDLRQQWVSSGFNNDATTSSITYNFSETLTVSRIALLNMNFKNFRVYYNGATASTFAMSTTAATSTANFSSNSSTSMILITTPVACTSVTIDIYSTIDANDEKALGYLVISDVQLDFPQIPNSSNYDIKLMPKRVEHTLSDGGTRIQYFNDVWQANVKLDYIDSSFTSALKTIYTANQDWIFCPFPTTGSSWDGIIFPCVWSGDYEFHEYSDNAANSGFSGKLTLKQIPL